MAAAVSEEPIVNPVEKIPGTSRGGGGVVHFHPGGDDGGGGDGRERWRPGLYRLAMWATVVAVTTLFVVLAVAYVLRSNTPDFWRPIRIPRILIGSTAVLLLSSVTCEAARRTLHRAFLTATLALGCTFLGMQSEAWRELASQGVFVAENPHSTFFYLFTGVHGIHLLAGIAMLWYMLLRAVLPALRDTNLAHARERADVAALYWHVMDGLWLGLFLLLWFRR
jgi:cytochrome c oxidase subunit III